MKISASNQLKGMIIAVEKGAVNTIVVLDIGGGKTVTSCITNNAGKDLELKVGMDAYAIVKASDVMIGVDE